MYVGYTASYIVKIIWWSPWFCSPPPLIWGSALLYLRSPKGGCYSISEDLSCSSNKKYDYCSMWWFCFEQINWIWLNMSNFVSQQKENATHFKLLLSVHRMSKSAFSFFCKRNPWRLLFCKWIIVDLFETVTDALSVTCIISTIMLVTSIVKSLIRARITFWDALLCKTGLQFKNIYRV